jgi:hypothetical protein
MLSNIVKGSHFLEALQYTKGKKQSQVLVKKINGRTVKQQVSSFEQVWNQRRRVQRPMFHVSLSVHYDDKVDAVTWRKIIRRYLREMGYKNCPYIAIRHSDRLHDHVHIIASRITHNGQLVSDSWDYLKSQNVLRRIEADFKLTPCPSSSECYERPPKIWEIQKNQQELRRWMQNTVKQTAIQSPNLPELVANLAQKQINVRFTPQGLRYEWRIDSYWDKDGNTQATSYTGSTLGKVFTAYGLKRYLLNQNHKDHALSSTANTFSQPALSPWLTHQKAKNLYYQYSAQADNLAQTAQIAGQNGWNWDAIRFMLAQSQWFAYIKKKVGRALALKALNVAIADGTDYTAPGMEYEKNYVELAFARQGYSHYLQPIGVSITTTATTVIETPTVREQPLPEEMKQQFANNTQQTQQHSVVQQSQPNNDYYFGLG